MIQTMYIMRGLPGSGKSYLAEEISKANGATICSADDYFISKETGNYNFNPAFLKDAHKQCFERAKRILHARKSVIIDNTNTTKWEVEKYVDLANHFDAEIKLVIPNTSWAFDVEECAKRNTHNVPKEAIQRMRQRFAKLYLTNDSNGFTLNHE